MTTPSLPNCVHESWEVPKIFHYHGVFYMGNITHNFSIGNETTTVNLRAILSSDRSPSPLLVLSIMKNDPHPSARVIVRLHDIKFLADSREVTVEGNSQLDIDSGPDSGEVELGLNELEEEEMRLSTNIPRDFQQFGLQTLNDFEFLLNDAATADVAIKVTLRVEKIFHSHKVILAARSPVFRAMFASQMKEAVENVVVIEDISAKTMEHFLSFLYCGHFQDESWVKCLPNLTYVGHKYEVACLKKLCDLHLIKSVTNQNAVAIASLAQCYELTNALAQIKIFIQSNAPELNFDLAKASEGLEIGQ